MLPSEQDEKMIRSALALAWLPEAPLSKHIAELEHAFLSKLLSSDLRPKAYPAVARVMLVAAARGFGGGYLEVTERGIVPQEAESPMSAPEILKVTLDDALALDYICAILDTPAIRSAELFAEMLARSNSEAPIAYYAVLGFLCGEVDGIREMRNGAAYYYSERRENDEKELSELAEQAAHDTLALFAEDVYITTQPPRENAIDKELIDTTERELLSRITLCVETFLRGTCDRLSNGDRVSSSVLASWASLYAYHHVFGFVEGLLGQEDMESDISNCHHPDFGSDAVSALLARKTCGNSDENIERALRHMTLTWQNNRRLRLISSSDAYWAACGVAYVEGLASSVEYLSRKENVLETLRAMVP